MSSIYQIYVARTPAEYPDTSEWKLDKTAATITEAMRYAEECLRRDAYAVQVERIAVEARDQSSEDVGREDG